MTIFGNFDFSQYGKPPGEFFCPWWAMHSCALIVSLTFFLLSWCNEHLSQFYACIKTCTILTISCASGLDYWK